MSARITSISLYKGVPLNQGAPHTLTFNNKDEQTKYFNTKRVNIQPNLSYQRLSNNSFKIGIGINSIRNCNYCSIVNSESLPSSDTRTYYAFIDNMEYISDTTTIVYYTIDFYQTYLFELIAGVRACYVEREHVNDDTKYSNTVKESFNLGEFCNRNRLKFFGSQQATELFNYRGYLSLTEPFAPGDPSDAVLNEISLEPRIVDGHFYTGTVNSVKKGLNAYADTPQKIIGCWVTLEVSGGNLKDTITIPSGFSEYTPVNQKLYNSEFRKIILYLPTGSAEIIPESQGDSITIYIKSDDMAQGALCYQYSAFGQNTTFINPDISVSSTYQLFSPAVWTTDFLNQYLAQNSSRINHNLRYAETERIQTARNLIFNGIIDFGKSRVNQNKIGTGLVSDSFGVANAYQQGNVIGALEGAVTGILNYRNNTQMNNLNTVQSIGNTINAIQNNKIAYNKIVDGQKALENDYSAYGSIASGKIENADFAFGNPQFLIPEICVYTPSTNIIKRIDLYFSRYGYQVNTVKKPNIYGRSKFNYVQTQGSLVTGEIPALPCITFQQQLDSGITFWHIGSDLDDTFVGDYTVENPIV